MTELDRPAFADAMLTLCETFNEPISDVKVEAYFSVLGEFDIERVSGAFRAALRQFKFFPRPADLCELIAGRADDAADAAWGAILGEIRRVGYIGTPNLEARTLRAINELWGGWRRLCETLPNEGPELVGWVKQFKSVYASVDRADQRALTMGDLHPNVRTFIQGAQKRLR
jgi:hypothetical protein